MTGFGLLLAAEDLDFTAENFVVGSEGVQDDAEADVEGGMGVVGLVATPGETECEDAGTSADIG